MTAPLVPANVDLRDFPFMPVEFGRLLASETWVLANDAEKVAALTLWGRAWAEVPAGSIPADDRMLAHMSGMATRWKKVKAMALRGWVLCDDGRYYHSVVCEKALESWLEKLAARLSSGAGNAKRWGTEFDPAPIEAQIAQARTMLAALNPASRQLRRKPPASKPAPAGIPESIPPGSNNHPDGSPELIPPGSQETGTGTGTVRSKSASPARALGDDPPVASPTDAGRACLLMREAGCIATNPSHEGLLAALREGVTPEALGHTAREAIELNKPKPFGWAIATARGRHAEGANPITGGSHATSSTSSGSCASERAQQSEREHVEWLAANPSGDDLIEGTSRRVG